MHTANGWLLQIRLYRENNDPAIGGGSVALHSLRTLTPTFISTPRPSSKGVRKKREHRAARLPPQATQEKRSAARLLSQTMGTQEIHATVPGMEKKMKLPCCRTHAAMAAADAQEEKLARCEENNSVGRVASDHEVPTVRLFIYHRHK
jgi:hypothetical protein